MLVRKVALQTTFLLWFKADVPSVTNRKGVSTDVVKVRVFDNTCEATLTLWGCAVTSASAWQTSSTVLLFTNAACRVDRGVWMSLTANTFVDVDPDIPDATWLRRFAHELTRRQHVNPAFPFECEYSDSSLFIRAMVAVPFSEQKTASCCEHLLMNTC